MKLKRTQLMISGVLLSAALILAIYFSLRPGDPLSGSGNSQKSIRELVALPLDIRADVAKEKSGANTPASCPGLFSRVTEGTVEDFRGLTDDDRNALHACSESLPILAKHDPAHLNSLRNSCITPDENDSNAMQSNCALYYYFYKAGLVAFFQKDKALTDLSTEALAQIFFHEYNNLDPQRLEALGKIADELAHRVPSFSVKKARASIAFFQYMQQPKPEKQDELLRSLQSLKDQNPHDEQLLELNFVVLALKNDVNAMNTLTETFVMEHPSSAAGFYVRSAYFWQIKDRAQTLQALSNALSLEPNTARYADTKSRVEAAEPGAPGVYSINVNFDLISD